ncbi:MAG: hypothetical protein RLZZ142_2044, partial [Verrucomicrobiota bacterium]
QNDAQIRKAVAKRRKMVSNTSMPNKRNPNKVQIGGYIDIELKRKLQALAKEAGVSLTEFLVQELEEQVARREQIAAKKIKQK